MRSETGSRTWVVASRTRPSAAGAPWPPATNGVSPATTIPTRSRKCSIPTPGTGSRCCDCPREVRRNKVQAYFDIEGYDHILAGLDAGKGVILALPHMGGWEYAAAWMGYRGHDMLAVVEPIEPPELYEWFSTQRRTFGLEIVPLGPDVLRVVLGALRDNRIVCLLSDRDLTGDGVEVTFFGERTRLPAGPATLALRTGATLLPAGAYFRGRREHLAVVKPPILVEREGRLRDDIARVTQRIAEEFEALIRVAPQQWHLMQPNWPSDRELTGMRVARRSRSDRREWSVESTIGGLIASSNDESVFHVPPGRCAGAGARAGARTAPSRHRRAHRGAVRRPTARARCRMRRPEHRVELERFGGADRAGRVTARRTAEAIRAIDPHLVHLHEPAVPGPSLSTLIGFNGPIVGTFHASGELSHQWTRPAMRSLMNRVTFRAAVSEAARETAQANWTGATADYVMLWNGIEIDRFANATPEPSPVPAVFFVGRHEQRKGLAVLLDAWQGLDRDAILWVAGTGPQTDELRARGGPGVVWLGSISDSALARAHARRHGVLRAVARR